MIYRLGRRKKLHAEINVVPYIDVMLVLLIIFMVLSPLLIQGIDVNLPRTDTTKMSIQNEPLVVSIARMVIIFLIWEKKKLPFRLMNLKTRRLLFLMLIQKLKLFLKEMRQLIFKVWLLQWRQSKVLALQK